MRRKNFKLDEAFLPPRYAGERTGFSVQSIREGCKAGTVPHIRKGRDYRIDMQAWLDKLHREAQQNMQQA